MGRIKTQLIKSTTKDVLAKHKDKFTTDFQKNKKILGTVADLPSKKIRNIMAGFITRIMKSPE